MAALEFALIAPVFIFIYVAGVDIVFMIQNKFRVEQASIQCSQVITQFTSLYTDDFNDTFFPIIETIAGNGSNKALTDATQVACAATISGLDYPATGVRAGLLSIVWQQSYNIGTCTANKIGTFNNATGLPVAPTLSNYTPPPGVPFIVVEVASRYSMSGLSYTMNGLSAAVGATQPQYSAAIAIPRQRVLPSITQGNRPSS